MTHHEFGKSKYILQLNTQKWQVPQDVQMGILHLFSLLILVWQEILSKHYVSSLLNRGAALAAITWLQRHPPSLSAAGSPSAVPVSVPRGPLPCPPGN